MSFTKKAAAAAGSLAALSLASQDANATIVHVDDSPVTLNFGTPVGTSVDWDVDGQFGVDFRLRRTFSLNTTFGTTSFSRIVLSSVGLNGQAFVNNDTDFGNSTDEVANLNTGFIVGPTLTNGYYFGFSNVNNRNVMTNTSGGPITIGYDAVGFLDGVPGNVGFRFDSDGTTLYGWAALTIDTASGDVTISEWAYETTGAPIAVGDTAVPEPHSLALVAMGAAGVAAWRSRRKKQSVESAE